MYVNSNWIDAQKGSPRAWVSVCVGGDVGEGGTPTPSRKTLRFIKQSLFNKREPPCVSECVGEGEGGTPTPPVKP